MLGMELSRAWHTLNSNVNNLDKKVGDMISKFSLA